MTSLLSFFAIFHALCGKYSPHITVNAKYLSDVVKLPESGLVVLWSDMGTGKTELLRRWRDKHPEQRFLNNGHRVNLLKNLANRLQTDIYSAIKQGDLAQSSALSITIDSLHKLNTSALNYNCVFIDEACQYLTHLLHSQTCKKYRAQILEVLEYIVYKAQLVVIADAHMDNVTVDFFRAMRPLAEQPHISKNNWKNGDRTIYWYEGGNSSALVAQISAALMAKQKIMVVSDSKRFVKNLEKSLTMKAQCEESDRIGLRLWSVHSENSGSEENVAFIQNITHAVKDLDALLVSPSLGTGVDIPSYHFDTVFGVFHAVSQTATECAQQLYRYRPTVPMHIWVAPRPPFGYKETNASKIKERLLETNEITAFLLRIDRKTGKRGVEKDWALDAYCQIQASRHQSINNLREDLHDLLADMGNKIIPMETQFDSVAFFKMKNAAEILDAAYYSAVASAKDISASEYSTRKSKDYLNPSEIFECEKFRILSGYGQPVTKELVKKDAGGKYLLALTSLEVILAEPSGTILESGSGSLYPLPPLIAIESDAQDRLRFPLCTDWSNNSARWLARFTLGLHGILKRLVAGEEITAADPDLIRMTQLAKSCAAHVKAILGFKVNPDCKPIWLLGMLVNQLGLKLTFRQIGSRGQQVKYYSLSQQELDFALKVIRYREILRTQQLERKQKRERDQTRYQVVIKAMYGLSPLVNSSLVFTPPPNCVENPLGRGSNTKDLDPKRSNT